MTELSTWQQIALVAGPAAAAIAALASWASVLQARRISREAARPELVIQKVVDTETQTIGAIVTNTGSAPARGAGLYLSFPPYKVNGPLGHGFMFPGDTRRVWTQIPAVGNVETDVLVLCRDNRSVPHYWNAAEKHVESKDWRRRPRYRKDLAKVFEELHPGVNLDDLTEVPMQVTNVS
jgi:hypothetical protein